MAARAVGTHKDIKHHLAFLQTVNSRYVLCFMFQTMSNVLEKTSPSVCGRNQPERTITYSVSTTRKQHRTGIHYFYISTLMFKKKKKKKNSCS